MLYSTNTMCNIKMQILLVRIFPYQGSKRKNRKPKISGLALGLISEYSITVPSLN